MTFHISEDQFISSAWLVNLRNAVLFCTTFSHHITFHKDKKERKKKVSNIIEEWNLLCVLLREESVGGLSKHCIIMSLQQLPVKKSCLYVMTKSITVTREHNGRDYCTPDHPRLIIPIYHPLLLMSPVVKDEMRSGGRWMEPQNGHLLRNNNNDGICQGGRRNKNVPSIWRRLLMRREGIAKNKEAPASLTGMNGWMDGIGRGALQQPTSLVKAFRREKSFKMQDKECRRGVPVLRYEITFSSSTDQLGRFAFNESLKEEEINGKFLLDWTRYKSLDQRCLIKLKSNVRIGLISLNP